MNSVAATQFPARLADAAIYPLAVLAGAMEQASTIPATFWLDNTYALVNSLLHKDLQVVLGGIPVRGRYWLAATGEPGTGKTPSLELQQALLKEIFDASPAKVRKETHRGTPSCAAAEQLPEFT